MRRFAIILFAAIALLSLDQPLLDAVTRREVVRAKFARDANRAPQFTAFIEAVRARTKRGDSIVLVAFTGSRDAYTYCYYRASYLLAGRQVIPIFTPDYQLRREAMAEGDYAAAFGARVGGAGRVVWRGEGGELVRQK